MFHIATYTNVEVVDKGLGDNALAGRQTLQQLFVKLLEEGGKDAGGVLAFRREVQHSAAPKRGTGLGRTRASIEMSLTRTFF